MDMPTLTAFFMWCTIINLALFVWPVVWFVAAPNLMYRVQSAFFPLPRGVSTCSCTGFSAASRY